MIDGPILLTGAGGDIGIALSRVLKETWPDVLIHGADCDPHAIGAEFVDRFHVLSRADAPEYLSGVRDLIDAHGVQICIPLAEAELARLVDESLIGATIWGAALITPDRDTLHTGLDKLRTTRALDQAGINVPETGVVGEDEPGHFDLVIKPPSGQGGKGLVHISRSEYEALVAKRAGDLWQRWLKDDSAEYTCGVVRFPRMPTRSIAFRRTLQGGLTGKGEVVRDMELTQLCEKVADALNLEGAINIQLRVDKSLPYVFEINPRFSSTVGFRHRLGFRDAIWAIESRLGLPVESYDPPLEGTRVERVACEVIRPPAR